jgi:hypothetical protein
MHPSLPLCLLSSNKEEDVIWNEDVADMYSIVDRENVEALKEKLKLYCIPRLTDLLIRINHRLKGLGYSLVFDDHPVFNQSTCLPNYEAAFKIPYERYLQELSKEQVGIEKLDALIHDKLEICKAEGLSEREMDEFSWKEIGDRGEYTVYLTEKKREYDRRSRDLIAFLSTKEPISPQRLIREKNNLVAMKTIVLLSIRMLQAEECERSER